MSLPAGMKLELAIGTAGAFVDVSADTDGSVAVASKIGRTSEFSAPSAGTWTITLDNSSSCSTGQGSYTPGRQVLYDGVTAHPYYPYIVPRVQARLSYQPSSTKFYRAYGYVKAWRPLLVNGMTPRVEVQVADILDQLSRITFLTATVQSMLADSPLALWPFTDPAGVASYGEIVGGKSATVISLLGSATVTSGSLGGTPYADNATGLEVAVDSTINDFAEVIAPGVATPAGMNTAWTFEAWIGCEPNSTTGDYATSDVSMSADSGATYVQIFVHNTTPTTPGAVTIGYINPSQSLSSASYQPADGTPHLYSVVGTDNGTNLTVKFYVNGALFDTQTGTSGHGLFGTAGSVTVDLGTSVGASSTGSGSVIYGPTSVYATSLSAARVAQHYYGGVGGTGQTTDQRIAEMMLWAGVATGNQNLDVGQEIVGQHPVATKTALTCSQDMATTEGGGSVFYATPDSKVRFANRRFRDSATPVLTIDAGADLDAGTFIPSIDDLTLINQSIVTRQGGATVIASNQASITADGLSSEQITTYGSTDAGALRLGQSRVAAQAVPGFRLPQIAVDLMTATSAGLYAAVAAVQIGSRIRVTNLDAAASPSATLDLLVEGWTETISASSYLIVFDTSPADNPPRWKWDTSRWQPVTGNLTLSSSISNSATTIVLANSDGKFMTNSAGDYPLFILIGAEVIQLTANPGGTGATQTFTGCVRGTNGTFAAAQTAGAVVAIWPVYTWAL